MTNLAPRLIATLLVTLGVTLPAFAQELPVKKFITPDGSGKRPNGMFASGLQIGKTVYVAGKGDYKPNEPLAGKVENCLNEVEKVLKQAGLDRRHIVKSFVYLEDHDIFAEFNTHYAKFFSVDPPARTTLGVSLVPGESRLEITCIAYADLAERKKIGESPAGLPFTPGILAGDTLYVSGKGDQLPDGSHPATIEEQTRQSMRNVETTLKQAGLDFRHVVMSHLFVDKPENIPAAAKVYGEFFKAGEEPACATIPVVWIPGGAHVEVTCIATTNLAGRKVVRPAGLDGTAGMAGMAAAASAAVWAGNTLYVSDLGGVKAGDTGELGPQVHAMAANHTKVLEAAGLGLQDIVGGWVYLRDMEDYNPMNAIYREYYSKGPGVRTCLMPGKISDKNAVRVHASFIAAKTQPAP